MNFKIPNCPALARSVYITPARGSMKSSFDAKKSVSLAVYPAARARASCLGLFFLSTFSTSCCPTTPSRAKEILLECSASLNAVRFNRSRARGGCHYKGGGWLVATLPLPTRRRQGAKPFESPSLSLSLSQPSVKPRMIASNFSPAPARAQVPALRPARNFLMLSTCFRLSFLLSPAPFISVEPMLPVRTVYSRSRFSTVRSEKAAGPARVAYIMRCMCVCIRIHTYTLFLEARVLFFTRSVEYIVQCKGARGDFRLFGESWLKFA